MTDDYKERIIKWLTGNYTIEPNSTDPLFQELTETTTTINTYVDVVLGYIQGKDGKGNDLDIGFIYGLDSNDDGVIIIVDSNFNIIQVITEWDSGTDFHEFICLNIDKTNGNIYGIDKNGSQYRFILMNNFMIKTPAQANYEAKLRNSYNISFTNSFTPQFVEKKPNESFYVINGLIVTSSLHLPGVATYKIEVGSTNELIQYNFASDGHDYVMQSYNITWSGDTYSQKVACYYTGTDQYGYTTITYREFEFDGSTITKGLRLVLNSTYLTPSMLAGYMSVVMTNNDTFICYPLADSYTEEYATPIYKVDYANNTYTEFTRIEADTTLDYMYSGGYLIKINNQIYFYLFANTTDPNDNTTAEFKLIFGTILYATGNVPYITQKEFDGLEIFNLVMYTNAFNVSLNYNLSTYNLIGSNSNILLSVQQVVNPLNYNYSDYQDINSMVPNSVWLYSNNELVYARNLYNKIVNGNTTISTAEVPNMILNDISLTPQKLLGDTNGILVNETEAITKNVYEDLFINFYNTLTMQDQNTATYVTNLNGATRLNTSISNIEDYSNAKIGKVRFNYEDNTTYIKTINPATQISQFVYQFSFNVYVPNSKAIDSIEIISNDEITSYLTINTTSLLKGKSYKITQNVEIGE